MTTYAQLPEAVVDKIKKGVTMTFVASTISEHIRHEGELIGEARSEERVKRAELRAERAALNQLEELFRDGLISKDIFETRAGPLKEELRKLSSQSADNG